MPTPWGAKSRHDVGTLVEVDLAVIEPEHLRHLNHLRDGPWQLDDQARWPSVFLPRQLEAGELSKQADTFGECDASDTRSRSHRV